MGEGSLAEDNTGDYCKIIHLHWHFEAELGCAARCKPDPLPSEGGSHSRQRYSRYDIEWQWWRRHRRFWLVKPNDIQFPLVDHSVHSILFGILIVDFCLFHIFLYQCKWWELCVVEPTTHNSHYLVRYRQGFYTLVQASATVSLTEWDVEE